MLCILYLYLLFSTELAEVYLRAMFSFRTRVQFVIHLRKLYGSRRNKIIPHTFMEQIR